MLTWLASLFWPFSWFCDLFPLEEEEFRRPPAPTACLRSDRQPFNTTSCVAPIYVRDARGDLQSVYCPDTICYVGAPICQGKCRPDTPRPLVIPQARRSAPSSPLARDSTNDEVSIAATPQQNASSNASSMGSASPSPPAQRSYFLDCFNKCTIRRDPLLALCDHLNHLDRRYDLYGLAMKIDRHLNSLLSDGCCQSPFFLGRFFLELSPSRGTWEERQELARLLVENHIQGKDTDLAAKNLWENLALSNELAPVASSQDRDRWLYLYLMINS